MNQIFQQTLKCLIFPTLKKQRCPLYLRENTNVVTLGTCVIDEKPLDLLNTEKRIFVNNIRNSIFKYRDLDYEPAAIFNQMVPLSRNIAYILRDLGQFILIKDRFQVCFLSHVQNGDEPLQASVLSHSYVILLATNFLSQDVRKAGN